MGREGLLYDDCDDNIKRRQLNIAPLDIVGNCRYFCQLYIQQIMIAF